MVSPDAGESKAEVVENLLRTSRELKARGDGLASGELMWGAFANAMIVIAEDHGWPNRRYRELRTTAPFLTGSIGSRDWRAQFGQAEGLHVNFYRQHLEEHALNQCMSSTEGATRELLGEIMNKPLSG